MGFTTTTAAGLCAGYGVHLWRSFSLYLFTESSGKTGLTSRNIQCETTGAGPGSNQDAKSVSGEPLSTENYLSGDGSVYYRG